MVVAHIGNSFAVNGAIWFSRRFSHAVKGGGFGVKMRPSGSSGHYCTFVNSGKDAHPKALNGLQAGLSIEQGVERVQQQGAQCKADKHGGEKV
jgi:hypothetical protein